MFDKVIFAERLKTLRTQNNLSMSGLAAAVGVSKQAIGQFEKSSNNPNVDTLVVLADYFDVSIDYLVGRSDDPTRR